MRGKFIVLEGTDGAGTTSQTKMLRVELKKLFPEKSFMITFTPSDGMIGELIRDVKSGKKIYCWRTMLSLFYADMVEHTRSNIIPLLDNGINVICDRYYPSTIVYQSVTGGKYDYAKERMWSIHEKIFDTNTWHADDDDTETLLEPDLILLLDVNPQTSQKRIKKRGAEKDYYEKEEFSWKIVELYKYFHLKMCDVSECVNAEVDKKTVLEECVKHARKLF